MGADTPPFEPRRMLTLTSFPANEDKNDEDKRDSKVDDDENEDEINNWFDTISEDAYDGDTGSSEDFAADVVNKRVGHVTNDEIAEEKSDVFISSPAYSDTSIHVLHEVDEGPYAVIDKTTVVEKYSYHSHEDKQKASDIVCEDEKFMNAVVSTSSPIVDGAIVSTLEYVTTGDTEELDDGTKSYVSCDARQHLRRDDILNVKPAHQLIGSRSHDKNDEKMQIYREEEQDVGKNSLSLGSNDSLSNVRQFMEEFQPEQDQVVDTMPDVDDVCDYEDLRNDTSKNQQPLKDHQLLTPPALMSAESQGSVKGRSNVTNAIKSVKAARRKLSLLSQSDSTENADDDSTGDDRLLHARTVASTHARTRKRPTHATTEEKPRRKQKKTSHVSKSPQTTPLRRSTRAKVESPNFTYSDMSSKSHGIAGSTRTSDRDHKCGSHATMSKRVAARHQKKSCQAYSRGKSKLAGLDDDEEKALSHGAVAVMRPVKLDHDAGRTSLAISLVDLMGTAELAAKLKHAFQCTSFVGHAPVSRFQQLIRNDLDGLRHLDVLSLLDAVNQLDGPIMQLHIKLPGVWGTMGQHRVDSVSTAKARSLESCSLRFPAPRFVAEQFIIPLAKELGLQYAMRQHRANVVSCPLRGTKLDWRFHRTETVVFQLRGKSIWKIKMSQVEYPLQCFHPDSWLLDDMVHVAKIHRVATMDKAAKGFLSKPAEDLCTFDEREGHESFEHGNQLLKPGSVAYLPAGTWFEISTQDPSSMWIEVQLASMTYESLAFSALKQLAWGDKQWRMGIQLYPGNRGHFKEVRHHVEACIRSLCNEMTELEGSDVLPEYLGTEDMHDLAAHGLIRDTSASPNSTRIEVDLTNPRFKLKHEKLYKGAAYRVNPTAVLLSVAEIPHVSDQDGVKQSGADNRISRTVQHPHHVLQKAVKPRPKRKQALHAHSHDDKHTYMLDELFGNDGFQSHLHVKFQCSAEHSRMVEWLRCRDFEPFDLEDFICCDSALRYGSSPTQRKKSAKRLLRFLCFVGHVTRLKLP